MKKNILKSLVICSAVLSFNFASAQTTTTKTSPTQKQTTTVTSTKQTSSDESNLSSKELGAKVNEWMQANLGTNDVQATRINVAATSLLTKVRDIRKTVTDADTRNFQIHQAMVQFEAQMKSVMTPEQSAKFQTMKKDFHNSFKEMKDETVTTQE